MSNDSKAMMDFSPKILRAIRKYFNLNQVELAEVLKIRQGTLSKIESGKLELSASQWIGLCNQYSLNPLCLLNGLIDEIEPLSIDPRNSKKRGSFKVNKKFLKSMGLTVRTTLPFLEFIEKRLGENEKRRFLLEKKIDPDYFIIQNLPINILFLQDIYNYLKIKNLLNIEELTSVVVETIFENIEENTTLKLKSMSSCDLKFKRYIKMIPSLYSISSQYNFVGDKSCYIQVRDTEHLKNFNLQDDFREFRMNLNLASFNSIAHQLGMGFEFDVKNQKDGWDLYIKEKRYLLQS